MRASVHQAFYPFSAAREGFTPFLYADTKNLVTTGIGNLVDTGPENPGGTLPVTDADLAPERMVQALGLLWRKKSRYWSPQNPVCDGNPVSMDETMAAWRKVKSSSIKGQAPSGFVYQDMTDLSLDEKSMRDLFDSAVQSHEAALRSAYPAWDNWPADAQLATLSMSWAMGPFASRFPKFTAVVTRTPPDFRTAAAECWFSGGGGTREAPLGRNAENRAMLLNAAQVLDTQADPEPLRYQDASIPTSAGAGGAPSAPTDVHSLTGAYGIAAGPKADRIAIARLTAAQALSEMGIATTAQGREILLAISWGETRFGDPGLIWGDSHNWGAVVYNPSRGEPYASWGYIEHGDHKADGTPVTYRFQRYPSDLEGAKDAFRTATRTTAERSAVNGGTPEDMATAMYDAHYYTGTSGTREDRIQAYANMIRGGMKTLGAAAPPPATPMPNPTIPSTGAASGGIMSGLLKVGLAAGLGYGGFKVYEHFTARAPKRTAT